MFAKIQDYKAKGFKKSQVSRMLEIDYKTVLKYWDMTPDEFAELRQESKSREKKVDRYKKEILEWLEEYRDLSAAQVYDWPQERYGKLDFKDRTLRLYVNRLRKEYDLPKIKTIRQYQEVDELAMGYQAQVDLGQIWLQRSDKSKIKVYCFTMALSHSRYKYIYWRDKPFTTQSFIEAHNKAFKYFGGMPKEIVYDQDRILVVSENHGDIIYTEGFQNYINAAKFKVYLCRGFDPESKGKIEAVVKYTKNNFAKHRTFIDIESFNEDCLKWLERTGNKKVHETTKKVPAEVFALEKQHLMPIPTPFVKPSTNNSLTYIVRKNNTVFYKQNRYQVPKGTYKPGKEVKLIIQDGKMDIYDKEVDHIIASHKISLDKGKLIKLDHPERKENKNLKTEELYKQALKSLGDTEDATLFIGIIKKQKPRHLKDQLRLIINATALYEEAIIKKALEYCIERKLFSATMLKDALEYLKVEKRRNLDKKYEKANISVPSKYQHIKPEIRDIKVYVNALKEDETKWKN